MRLIGQQVLKAAGRKNAPLRNWLTTWAAVAENKRWTNLNEVRVDYPAADGVKLRSKFVVTVFSVKGHGYRLLTSIDYDAAIIEALDVLTHSEYDKELWKDRH